MCFMNEPETVEISDEEIVSFYKENGEDKKRAMMVYQITLKELNAILSQKK